MNTSGSSHSAGILPAEKGEASSQRTPGPATGCNPEEATIISQRPPERPVSGTRGITPFELSKQLAGERLNHFQLLEYVGGGGMGAVFRALDTMLNREVALKVLSRDQGSDEETRRRFQNEAQSAARLDHENIARVYYVGEDRGLNYIVFEFIEGVNLRDVVERQGPLPVAGALSYTLQVAHALAHACSRDVVHRDIKPSNLIVMSDGRAKLVDMGLARLHQVQSDGEDLTASGVTLGTFDYISPEQARDPRVADVRSDIYSLGCTLYFMLTGRPPFPDGTVLQKLLQHNSDPPPDPREINPSLPAETSLLVSKMLAKDPLRRYQHPSALIADLHLLAEQLGCPLPGAQQPAWTAAVPTSPPSLGVVRHLPWLLPVAALLFIAAVLDRDWPGWLDPPLEQVAANVAGADPRHQTTGAAAGSLADRKAPPGVPDKIQRSPRESARQTVRPLGDGARTGDPDREVDDRGATAGRYFSEAIGGEPAAMRPSGDESKSGRRESVGIEEDDSADVDSADSTQVGGPAAGVARDDGASAEDGGHTPPVEQGNRAAAPTTATGPSRPPISRSTKSANAVDPADSSGGSGSTSKVKAASTAGDLEGSGQRTQAVAQAADVPELGVHIVGDGLKGPRRYARLAEACAAAKSGDRIELHYDGRREELPLLLTNVQVEVRPGAGYRPIVLFRPNETNPIAFPRSMMTVSGGAMKLVDLAVELDLSLAAPSENWSLIELRSADLLTAENCLLTVRNATDSTAAYHDKVAFVKVTANRGTESMMPGSAPASPIVQMRLMNCVARGEAAFVFDQDALPFDLSWRNGLLATSERMLSLGGGAPMLAADDDRVRVNLKGFTALVRQGFCRIVPAPPAQPTRLEVECDDCLFLTDFDGQAFLEQSGSEPLDRQQARVRWRGDHNEFRGFSALWQLASSAAPGQASSLNYQQWLGYWKPGGASISDEAAGRALQPVDSLRQPLHTVAPADLSDALGVNDASTDGPGSTVGFDARKMPAWAAAAFEKNEADNSAVIAPKRDGSAPIRSKDAGRTVGTRSPPSESSDPDSSLPPEMPPRTDRRLNDDRGP